jgi:hypothetical protein
MNGFQVKYKTGPDAQSHRDTSLGLRFLVQPDLFWPMDVGQVASGSSGDETEGTVSP